MKRKRGEILGSFRIQTQTLAEAIVDRHYRQAPDLASRYGPDGRRHCVEDATLHLRYLAEAIEAESEALFVDYVQWARMVLQSRGIHLQDLVANLECLREELKERYNEHDFAIMETPLRAGLAELTRRIDALDSYLEQSALEPLASSYLQALLSARRSEAVRMIQDAVADGLEIRKLYLQVFQPVQYELGRLWQLNQISVAQEHYCTAVTQLVMSQLYPEILKSHRIGNVLVSACIGGDLHEIGSRMVADLFELEGWTTVYLGANTPVSGITAIVAEQKADLLALSATMTYHIPMIRQTIEQVRNACSTAILVGGRPFNIEPDLWKDVGADGHAADAAEALKVAARLVAGGGA